MKTDIQRFLEEDIGFGDITSEYLLTDEKAVAVIAPKQDCVLAGVEEAVEVFARSNLKVDIKCSDGESVQKATEVMRVEGDAKSILSSERVALNILARMSGIATLTRRLVDMCRKANPEVRVACTRKTTPGFRYYEKKAVALGGGDPHRFRLDDAVLIKDNHIKVVGSVEEALTRAKRRCFAKKVEVEVEGLRDALAAARAGADIIMLDNMEPEEVKKTAEQIKKINKAILVEASGGITADNILEYAPHVDVVSLGLLTHSAPAIDFSLEIVDVLHSHGASGR